ncbi:MAG: hypothetical protein WC565_07485 [Parcubacteria group bacterium]
MSGEHTYPFTWRDRRYLRARRNKPCRIVSRGVKGSCVVEFEDGARSTTLLSYLGTAKR